ncbi:MAG: hypothetical protein WBI99_05635 [Limnochordia bacterium]|jgi:formate dehydrogenase maturation protein FdhE|nr:hypothetical protein [Limnochordia bacterium]MDI9464978.1 hypothetical protein [Bacillota bacterium]NLO95836.1 hypothetical protein [Bacillota bacterium]HOB41151.1 hypothetical protein [Limnochordia bacterium]HOK32096.1 hypothetical protein [Limnochordia bacterium]
MVLQEVLARLKGDGDQVLKKALRCSSAEELLELAGEHGIELSEAEAAEVLSLLRFLAGELTEVELDVVTGGSGQTMKKCPECGSASATLVGEGHGLELWRCNNCNTTFL